MSKIINGFEIVKDSNINRILEYSKIKIGLNKNILIITNDFFNSPFITGISDIKIYIPKKVLESMSEEKLTYIILHELLHYKNKDLIVNILQAFVTIVYWFNPFIWLAMKLMKEDRELARYYDVLKIIRKENSLSYGMTILEISEMFLNNSRNKVLDK
ncbi:M56 family metallopeptidase [Tissierella praeacuta]|uniref:M56 family metallopeptidase n=1 Tax=Tissierella praeacuta TaxID=43131 RepID=UPI00333EF230